MKYWQTGDHCVYRGIADNRVWSAQSVIVVKDSPDETILLQEPGSQCVVPEGYWRWHAKVRDYSNGTRWDEAKAEQINHRAYLWHTNRILMFLEPEKFYSCWLLWNQRTDEFIGYYINFQLPFWRTRMGFDTLDLDLDIVIEPSHEWRWKDEEDYRMAVESGGILPEWAQGIEQSYDEVFERINHRLHPLDGYWLDWRPDPAWKPPVLPDDWEIL